MYKDLIATRIQIIRLFDILTQLVIWSFRTMEDVLPVIFQNKPITLSGHNDMEISQVAICKPTQLQALVFKIHIGLPDLHFAVCLESSAKILA